MFKKQVEKDKEKMKRKGAPPKKKVEIKVAEPRYYEANYSCTNCDWSGTIAIPKGQLKERGKECPNCGCLKADPTPKELPKYPPKPLEPWYPRPVKPWISEPPQIPYKLEPHKPLGGDIWCETQAETKTSVQAEVLKPPSVPYSDFSSLARPSSLD